MNILVDAHQDLAWNMLTFGRDYSNSADQTRVLEKGSLAPIVNGETLLGWSDFQMGRIAVIFSTLFVAPIRARLGEWDNQCYVDSNQARKLYRTQMDAYLHLVDEHQTKFRLIETKDDLESILSCWKEQPVDFDHEIHCPVGLLMLMEGAECVRNPAELEEWWQAGVRIIGPTWMGSRYCGGTSEPGPLTRDGIALLEAMGDLGFILDLSHMDEKAAYQALELYPGTIIASHSNASALIKGYNGNRHLSDEIIHRILERDGVIGIVPFNSFLLNGWKAGDDRGLVSLDMVAAHLDHVCQLAGDALHAGIGTDFDGGFGVSSTPAEIGTIADLQKIAPLLANKGYSDDDIAAIFSENWLRKLYEVLP